MYNIIFSNIGLNSKSYKLLKCPLSGEQINKLRYTMKYYTAVKINFSFTHLTTTTTKKQQTQKKLSPPSAFLPEDGI